MEFTDLDNKAWELFLEATPNSIVRNQAFFVHHKIGYPYYPHYDRAKLELRKEKIKKLRNG